MKKVKIMLMSALVVAAVGGALAFKTKSYSVGLKCGTAANSCPDLQTIRYTFTTGAHFEDWYCTKPDGDIANCTIVTFEP